MKKYILISIVFLLLNSCSSVPLDLWPDDDGTTESDSSSATAGIFIAEYQTDTVLKYSSTTGKLLDVLYQASVGENLTGLVKYDDENLLVLVDSGSERVDLLNVITKEVTIYAQHVQFVGATRKLFFDSTTGILLVPEANTIEKFINGTRINTSATAFISASLTNPQKAIALSNDKIVVLNTGVATVELRYYSSAGVFEKTITMPAVDGNGEPYDVIETGGYFYVSYYTAGRIARFALDGTGGTVILQDVTGVKDCTSPAAMAVRPNGNFLVYCAGEPGIMEIDTSGNIVKTVSATNIMISQMVELE